MDARGQANLQKLVEAVQDPSASVLVANLIKLAVQTLRELAAIDEWIVRYFLDHESELGRALSVLVPRLRQGAFRRVHGFIDFLVSQNLLERRATAALAWPNHGTDPFAASGSDDGDIDGELDFGAFDDVAAAQRESQPFAGVEEVDIEEAFGVFAQERQVTSREKMHEVRESLRALGHALRETLDSTESLIDKAFAAGKYEAVLREIDMGRDSLTEGMFAIVTSIFDVFRCEFRRAAFLPGYRNALQKSLMIRHALADLTQAVREENEVVQDDTLPPDLRQYALKAAARALQEFRAKPAFQVMRWVDQLELSDLHDHLCGDFASSVVGCEALTRYLESLSIVNQREVLLEHDRKVMEDVHQALDAARSLVEVSVAGARPLVAEAVQNATRLYGRHPVLDEQLRAWRDTPPAAKTSADLVSIMAALEERLV